MPAGEIELTVFPDDCDSVGLVGHGAFVRLFERSRWEMLARGPGVDVFERHGLWPAVRRSVLDFHAPVKAGDVLRFHHGLTHLGRTSFTLRQVARRAADDAPVATGEYLVVCVDRQGQPQAVPDEIGRLFSARPSGDPIDRITVN